MGVSDYLAKIEELTNTNLKLLKTLNDSFFADQSYLNVDLGENGSYVLPSFVSLENKVNMLQNNFENLVNAPKTSEAHFTFDGNSRVIEVFGYEQSPNPVMLTEQTTFDHEENDTFKDFLSPVPYLKFDVSSIPDNLTTVVIKKVVALSEKTKGMFSDILGENVSKVYTWGDMWKMLEYLEEGVDYEMYDKTSKLPIRTGQGYGNYVIDEILEDTTDSFFDQHVTLQFATDIPGFQDTLSYMLFDQTIERYLSEGDNLVTWDGTCKFEVEELNFNTNTIKLRVLYGDYTNLFAANGEKTNIPDEAKLRFFSRAGLFNEEKYVKVPLEENQYIFVTIAPLNDRVNIRAPWGDGLVVDVDKLINSDDTSQGFRDYYNSCKNIGDILNEISSVMTNTISKYSREQLDNFESAQPVLDTDIIKVIHINKHLDESTTIQNIRALYAQKNDYNSDLTETQNSITALQEQLSTVDFQDTTGIRVSIQNQIDDLTAHKNDLVNSLIKISDEISLEANNSIVPIENAKYRIRGFFDFQKFAEDNDIDEQTVKGILVQYKYRNTQQSTGTAVTFTKDYNGDGKIEDERETFIYSDWNLLDTPLRPRIRNEKGEYVAEADTSNLNVPSFNQIDIPVTQGEDVDVRLKVIYDLGYPYVQIMSGWSEIVTFTFPEEFIKDVQIVDILEENNNDIETNRFNTILANAGVLKHVEDDIVDQDVTFFHKPESISSGFYTAERRIIPLRDKLQDMHNKIVQLVDEIEGTAADQLSVSFDFDESSIELNPFEKGTVLLKEYSYFEQAQPGTNGNYEVVDDNNKYVAIACNIKLTNKSDHSLKLFSMFPATEGAVIDNSSNVPTINTRFNKITNSAFKIDDFKGITYYDPANPLIRDGVRALQYGVDDSWTEQLSNQIITFRNNNPYDDNPYYETSPSSITLGKDNILAKGEWKEGGSLGKYYDVSFTSFDTISGSGEQYGMCVYPRMYKKNGLLMSYKEAYSYMLMNPGDKIVIPIMVEYCLSSTMKPQITKTIAFDIRTSLYKDPMHYTVEITAKYNNTPQDKLVGSLVEKYKSDVIKTKQYNTVVS